MGGEEETIFALEKSFGIASEVSARRAMEPVYAIWKMKRWFGVGSERRLKTAVAEVHRNVMNIIDKRRRKKKMEDIHDSEDLLSRWGDQLNHHQIIYLKYYFTYISVWTIFYIFVCTSPTFVSLEKNTYIMIWNRPHLILYSFFYTHKRKIKIKIIFFTKIQNCHMTVFLLGSFLRCT